MNTQSRWLFEAPLKLEIAYANELEFENELEWLNEYKDEQLEADLKYWNESTSNYFDRDESPFPDIYRWPQQRRFKPSPAETIKTGPYQTALCPAFDDFLELWNLVRDFRVQLGTRPTIPRGLRDRQAIKRWQEAIRAWEQNIRAWEKKIDLLIRRMITRLRDKSYVGQGCTKLFFRDLAEKVDSLRGRWTRSGTMLGVRQATDKRLETLRKSALNAAK
jgi:hypothetical protein